MENCSLRSSESENQCVRVSPWKFVNMIEFTHDGERQQSHKLSPYLQMLHWGVFLLHVYLKTAPIHFYLTGILSMIFDWVQDELPMLMMKYVR